MKQNNLRNLRVVTLGVGLALGSIPFTPALLGQPQTQNPNAQQDQQKTQTFTGKIVKLKDGQFALLMDAQAGRGLFLDNQDKAKQFEGQNVKVTGVLEIAKGLLHITAIEPA